MSTPTTETIKCPYCGAEHDRCDSSLGRLGDVVYHRCRSCHGDFSFNIDPEVDEGQEYWEIDR